nr:hypothetical protein [Legionella jordanis]
MTAATEEPVIIETLILVAIWDIPSIFQGCFHLATASQEKQSLVFFRCECALGEAAILDDDFSEEYYQFTQLYRDKQQLDLAYWRQEKPDSLYILKYALHLSLQQMLRHNNWNLKYTDEIALSRIEQSIETILHAESFLKAAEHLGFAVAIPFIAHENNSQQAIDALLTL